MTALELTTWSGVDKNGAFIWMFGGINTTPDPDEMRVVRLNPAGVEIGRATCRYVSDSSFILVDNGLGDILPDSRDSTVTFAVADSVLTMTVSALTYKGYAV